MLIRIIFQEELDAERSDWLASVVDRPPQESNIDLHEAFLEAPQRFGRDPWVPQLRQSILDDNNLSWLTANCRVDEVARILILAHATQWMAQPESLVEQWFRDGGVEEKRAVLRALSVLHRPKAYVELAVIACLSSERTVFEAICYDNPYPAAFFSEAAFNHMVERALFTGRSLDRVIGLAQRRNAELSRLAASYADERIAAGRTVPSDVSLLMEE